MSVTLKEIARSTGLSLPTVGNVLGRSAHRYSEKTRLLVQKAARDLGYLPNSSARAMRQGRFDCATLVLSRSRRNNSYVPEGLLDGLDDELGRHGMHLTVSRLTDEELSQQDFLPKVLRQYMADGMIVNYTHEIPPGMLDLIHAHHAPAVWLNAKLPTDCVYPDDLAAAQSTTEELLKLGHRRITFLHLISLQAIGAESQAYWMREHYSAGDRALGYKRAMQAVGLDARVIGHDQPFDDAQQFDVCRRMLSGPDRPTAVLIYSDHDLSLLMCAAASLGLSVPRDLSIVVFYPVEPWAGGKWVSAVHLPTVEIGRRAVRMLLRKIEQPNEPCAPEPVPYHAVLSDTVAPPPQTGS